MTIPVPLAVSIGTSKRQMHVTHQVRDLTFRSVVPGGFASAQISLDRPLAIQPQEIALYGTLVVTDGRHGGVLWEGRLEDPGSSAGSDGMTWELAAVGPSAHAHDRSTPLIYVDTSNERFDRYIPDDSRLGGWDATLRNDEADNPEIFMSMVIGTDPPVGARTGRCYRAIRACGMKLARVTYWRDCGVNTNNYQVECIARTGNGSGDVVRSDDFSLSSASASAVVVTNWTNGRNQLEFRINRSIRVAPVNDDDHTAWVEIVAIRSMLVNKSGTELTSGYTADTILASEVVADLLGRVLDQYDGANATVTTTSFAIDQVMYWDGATSHQIFEDLMTLEPAYYWAAWEKNPTTEKYRFEWVQWPTTVRYEADVYDGFTSPGSAAELYNTVRVRYRDRSGMVNSVQRTLTVPELDDAGLTREAQLDLGDNVGSQANAEKAGDEFLEEHQHPPNAGTLTVARPILDHVKGRMVMPWEIVPGTLVRVRGVQPSVDSLNQATRDGVTVFRIVSVDFRASDAAATLELDSYSHSVARALAKLATPTAASASRRR